MCCHCSSEGKCKHCVRHRMMGSSLYRVYQTAYQDVLGNEPARELLLDLERLHSAEPLDFDALVVLDQDIERNEILQRYLEVKRNLWVEYERKMKAIDR